MKTACFAIASTFAGAALAQSALPPLISQVAQYLPTKALATDPSYFSQDPAALATAAAAVQSIVKANEGFFDSYSGAIPGFGGLSGIIVTQYNTALLTGGKAGSSSSTSMSATTTSSSSSTSSVSGGLGGFGSSSTSSGFVYPNATLSSSSSTSSMSSSAKSTSSSVSSMTSGMTSGMSSPVVVVTQSTSTPSQSLTTVMTTATPTTRSSTGVAMPVSSTSSLTPAGTNLAAPGLTFGLSGAAVVGIAGIAALL